MNKPLLSPILIALLSAQVNAAEPVVPSDAVKETTTSTIATPPPAPELSTPTETAPAQALDCNYHIPATQTAVDPSIVTTWAEKAALQSFTFAPTTIQSQLDVLKTCYTEQGWKGFNDALQKSGNVDSIKNQQLSVAAQTEGTASINMIKEGQWKVTLPIQVVYQNDKEKVIQHLSVGLLVGRKPNGDLGVMQLVATAKPDESLAADKTTSAPAATTPASAEQKSTSDMQTAAPNANDTPAPPPAESQPVEPTPPKPAQ